MYFQTCSRCGKETAHQRALGAGTILMVLVTCGLWLLAIPFYPSRCIHCGQAAMASELQGIMTAAAKLTAGQKLSIRELSGLILAGLALILLLTGLIVYASRDTGPQPEIYFLHQDKFK